MNIKGKVIEIYEAKQVSEKFRKREFVIEYTEDQKFPQFIKFELHQNNTELIGSFAKGDFVDVSFDLRGKPWTNKQGETTYFTSLVAWRINKTDKTSSNYEESEFQGDDSGEDLPF